MTDVDKSGLHKILDLHVKSFGYDVDSPPLLKDVSLGVRQAEIVGLMGPNGSGKSTLLYLAAGELNSPTVHRSLDCDEMQISFVYQDYRHTLFPWKTARSNIALPGKLRGMPVTSAMINALAESFAFRFDLNKHPFELSGGEQQKVCVVRALAEVPKLLLMDEPCSAMDYASRLVFLQNLRERFRSDQTACVMVSHSAEDAFLFCDRLLLLSQSGRIVGSIENCQDSDKYNENVKRVHEHFLDQKSIN